MMASALNDLFSGRTEAARLRVNDYLRQIVRPYGFVPQLAIKDATETLTLSLFGPVYALGSGWHVDHAAAQWHEVNIGVVHKLWGTPELEQYLRAFCILAGASTTD
jgi:hypothetical protein